MRKAYIAGNWKMNNTTVEAKKLAKELVGMLGSCESKIMIAPSFTSLAVVKDIIKGTNILLGAQNVSNAESGAHTGEVSADMLKDIGVDVIIIGHSERRIIYKEDDILINSKVKMALSKGFEVILCVGETLEQREAGQAANIVKDQLITGLAGISKQELEKITIAYEPVWAIGTGKTATPKDADDIHKEIRLKIKDMYDSKAADSIIIQYGGSVKPDNAKELMSMENLDGALVGGASLSADSFKAIAEYYK